MKTVAVALVLLLALVWGALQDYEIAVLREKERLRTFGEIALLNRLTIVDAYQQAHRQFGTGEGSEVRLQEETIVVTRHVPKLLNWNGHRVILYMTFEKDLPLNFAVTEVAAFF